MDELEAAAAEPSAFLRRLVEAQAGPAAIRMGVARLRHVLEPRLAPLTWDDVRLRLFLSSPAVMSTAT